MYRRQSKPYRQIKVTGKLPTILIKAHCTYVTISSDRYVNYNICNNTLLQYNTVCQSYELFLVENSNLDFQCTFETTLQSEVLLTVKFIYTENLTFSF